MGKVPFRHWRPDRPRSHNPDGWLVKTVETVKGTSRGRDFTSSRTVLVEGYPIERVLVKTFPIEAGPMNKGRMKLYRYDYLGFGAIGRGAAGRPNLKVNSNAD